MVVVDATIVNIALPHIRTALGFSAPSLSWVVNAYTLTFGGLLLLGARCGDILGRRRTFTAGIGLFVVASLAGGFATSEGFLLASRAAQGVGGALAAPSALALLMIEFTEPRARSRAIGWYTAVSIGGSALGLLAGGMLVQWLSWRFVFFVNVPIGIAVLAAAQAFLPETPTRTARFDLAGACTSTLGMGAVVYGFVEAATDGWTASRTVGAFIVGICLVAVFIAVERRAVEPIVPLRLFADRRRSASYLARLLMIAGMFGVFFFLTQFLQNLLGYDPLKAGIAFVPLTVALLIASQVTARRLIETIPTKVLLVGGLTLSTVGLLWLSRLSATSGYLDVLGPLLMFGTGNGLAFVPLTSASLAGVEPKDAGAASGLVNVVQQVGGSLGLAVLVSIYGSASRSSAATSHLRSAALVARHAFVAGADRAFFAAALLLAVTVLIVWGAIGTLPPPAAPDDRGADLDLDFELGAVSH